MVHSNTGLTLCTSSTPIGPHMLLEGKVPWSRMTLYQIRLIYGYIMLHCNTVDPPGVSQSVSMFTSSNIKLFSH